MLIIRVATKENQENEVRTFTFDTEKNMQTAAHALKRTSCKGFAADVTDVNASRGKIIERWDRSNGNLCSLYHAVDGGPYKDRIFEIYGLKDECMKSATETNARVTNFASRRAHFLHVVGSLYKVVYTDPFTD